MKCHAGVEFPSGKPCPKCGAKLGEVCWPGINADLLEVAQLRKENEHLRAALKKIANPIGYFQEYAKQEGREIDGRMAVQISKDPGWLSSEAAKALSNSPAVRTTGEA
jgi:hypothetical protein